MLSKRLGVLAVLFISPALAQAPSTISPLTTAIMSLSQHAPMRFHRLRLDGAVESENWSGYAVTGSSFTEAEGSWVVPKADCAKTPNTYAAFWVGIDGYSSKTVEQTGTLIVCVGKSPVYYSWYEFYPKPLTLISKVPVSPGDSISAQVTYSGSEFTINLTNETTGKAYSASAEVSGAERSSAEWIAEAPTSIISGVLPLTDFVQASFGMDYTDVSNTNYATDSSTSGPISDFSGNVEMITMVSSKGKDEAIPSALTTDGTSFTVAWKSE